VFPTAFSRQRILTVEILQLPGLRPFLQDSSTELPANCQLNSQLTPRRAAIWHHPPRLLFTGWLSTNSSLHSLRYITPLDWELRNSTADSIWVWVWVLYYDRRSTGQSFCLLSLGLILWPTVSRPVCLGIKHPSEAYDQIFITVRQLRVCSLWREDGSVVYNCCWPSLAQSFSGPSPLELVAIFYCLRFKTSLFVASYDSRGTVEVFETSSTPEVSGSPHFFQNNSSARTT
jgi:hypothetical protein